jgi:hypothetical protein
VSPPVDAMAWATSGQTNVTTYGHVDGQGTATAVRTVTGSKYWVLYKERRENKNKEGDIMSMWGFDKTEVDKSLSEHFDHEAVVLTADSVL